MNGLPTPSNPPEALLNAVKTSPPDGDFIWDGQNEDERPLSREEMQTGIATAKKRRGRPNGSNKVSTTIRLDQEIISAFKTQGAGWQSRINAVLREWVANHPTP